MVAMYRVQVRAIDGPLLVCRVYAVYPDEPLLPSRTLAFRFVWEPWWDFSQGLTEHLPPNHLPMTNEEARERGRTAPIAEALAEQDVMNDLDWCLANADRFIACVGVSDICPGQAPDPAAGLDREYPHATYTIAVTEAKWLAHLMPGMDWETPAFDDDVWPRVQPTWLTPTVLAIARRIQEDGTYGNLPVLADALEEAGCDYDDLLHHCRGNGPHVPGCWAVERVLESL